MISASNKLIGALALTAAAISGLTQLSSAQSSGAGPSSSQPPYVVPTISGVLTRSILTVGDAVNNKPDGTPYRMVGIPDGLGAFDNGDGTFTVLMNHEIPEGLGAIRAHGSKGAFVSKWIVRKSDLTVLGGSDVMQQIATWNPLTGSFNALAAGVPIGRLCSADLPAASAFYNAATRRGYNAGRIYMNGEEVGAEGRAFAHVVNGPHGGATYELPYLGKFSWENSVAHPATGNKTVVVGTDDATPGQVYVYVGNKTNTGNPIKRAGLGDGKLYGIRVAGVAAESRETGIASGTAFDLYNFGTVAYKTGAELEEQSDAHGVTEFLRPEDGAWDPQQPNHFYFATTDRFDQVKAGVGEAVGRSRLWRLRFIDAARPTLGGQIDMLLDGTEAHQSLDNLTIRRGQVFMQEDPGNNVHLGKLWRYDIAGDALRLIAQHDPNRFVAGAPNFITEDEESSGIIDVSEILGAGWYLLDVQAHNRNTDIDGDGDIDAVDEELVEGGQLLVLKHPERRR
ncbi:MAG: alkaline phosphatase PhoX [Pyrinomonadaceae bacterium]